MTKSEAIAERKKERKRWKQRGGRMDIDRWRGDGDAVKHGGVKSTPVLQCSNKHTHSLTFRDSPQIYIYI